jgi:predicted ribosome quality control (RQC) complex YloA/Tae2 family protein
VFDLLTIAAVVDELSASVLDGRVQHVGMLTSRSLAFEIYAGGRRRHLVASAESEDPKLLLLADPPSLDAQLVTPLLLLLRKHVRGGVIVGINQPPLERLVRLSIAKGLRAHNEPDATEPDADLDIEGDESETLEGLADARFVHLSIELMGRQSNVILVDDRGLIMESAKRVTSRMSRVRPIAPKRPFTDPPVPPDRLDPRRLTAQATQELFSQSPAGTRVAQLLSRELRGVSPQMAREIVFLATGSTETTAGAVGPDDAAATARETRRLLEPLLTGTWQPTVYRDADGVAVAFSAVRLQHLAERLSEEAAATISAAAAAVVEPPPGDAPTRHAARRARLLEAIQPAIERCEARLRALDEQGERARSAERWRRWGELTFAYLWQIQPGQGELIVDGEAVPLDPTRPAKEVAQEYFERYRKARGAADQLPALVERAQTELDYLRQLATLAGQASAFQDFEALAAEWHDLERRGAGTQPPFKRSAPKKRPRPLIDAPGNAIYIGRSGTENDAITFDIAGPDDTWLHARGVPGSHVVIRWRTPDAAGDPRSLEAAASLAAFYSGSRGSAFVEVDHTARRHVRKIKGAGPGMVTYRNERTLRVRPASEQELGLES